MTGTGTEKAGRARQTVLLGERGGLKGYDMTTEIFFLHDGNRLYDAHGRLFNPETLTFIGERRVPAPSWVRLKPKDAVLFARQASGPLRPPVGVIGPREATDVERDRAYRLGRELASAGLTVLCGGRQGVMEEACRGVAECGGISVGLLPEQDWKSANRHVTVPIATGIGIARNALIACAAPVIVAVGGGLGTLSEMALGVQFGRRVFSLSDTKPGAPGVEHFSSWEDLAPHFYAAVLGFDSRSATG